MTARRWTGTAWVPFNEQTSAAGVSPAAPIIKVWRDGISGLGWYPISAIKRWTGTAWVDVYTVQSALTGMGTIAQQQALVDRTIAKLRSGVAANRLADGVYDTQAALAEAAVPIPAGNTALRSAIATVRTTQETTSAAFDAAEDSITSLLDALRQAALILRNPSDVSLDQLRLVSSSSLVALSTTSFDRWITAREALEDAISARIRGTD